MLCFSVGVARVGGFAFAEGGGLVGVFKGAAAGFFSGYFLGGVTERDLDECDGLGVLSSSE